MSVMRIFKVTLEPKDWFFFGGASTFDNGTKTSYIAHSMLLPQQTALLGMIRYQLLKQNNLLFGQGGKPDMSEVKKLIGENSFCMNDDSPKSFGAIIGISPVFLEEYKLESQQAMRELYPLSLTNSYKLSFNKDVRVYMTDKEKKMLIDDNDSFVVKEYENFMKYGDKDGNLISTDNIFETRMQVGITKNTDFKPEEGEKEGNFFKHEMVRFRSSKDKSTSFRYAFFVQLNNQEIRRDHVFLGAERSCFDMKIIPVEGAELKQLYLDHCPSKCDTKGRIEILSPTYVEDVDKLDSLCDFHWSYIIPFRNITFNKDGKGKLNSGNVSYDRGAISYNMLCSGSVLFFDESKRKDIEDMLNKEYLQSVGYNYFSSMNNNKNK